MTSNQQSNMIIEGFICPECQQDMSSIEHLQAHFELEHSNKTSRHQHSNGKISHVFAKAKTLITSDSDPSLVTPNAGTSLNPVVSNSYVKQYLGLNQSEGEITSHTAFFKKQREQTIGRYVVQTNKVLITLDKLITFDSSTVNDELKRDAHYKSIVSWVKDKDVNLCPNCARGFNILCRKHHCRLCGAIMCNQCSQFISLISAKNLTDGSFNKYDTTGEPSREFKLRRSNSITSLNSYFFHKQATMKSTSINGLTENQKSLIFLRLCPNCSFLLEKVYRSSKDKQTKSTFVDYYESLNSSLTETKRLLPIYTKMSDSLNSGEAVYQLSNAEEMRSKLVQLFKQVESLSDQILKFDFIDGKACSQQAPTDKSAKKPALKRDQMRLQRSIRMHTINYLKENSLTIGQLPTREVYQGLKAQRQAYMQEEMNRVEREQQLQKRQLDEVARQRRQINEQMEMNANARYKQKEPIVSIDNGWIANSSKKENGTGTGDGFEPDKSDQANALKIQIELVGGYLEEALKANRYEEAEILQQNLNELLNVKESI